MLVWPKKGGSSEPPRTPPPCVRACMLYVLLNVSNWLSLWNCDTAQEYIEAEEEKGHAVDDMFLCGKTVIPSLIIEMDLL